jgi:CheY-like chemotaxis protein
MTQNKQYTVLIAEDRIDSGLIGNYNQPFFSALKSELDRTYPISDDLKDKNILKKDEQKLKLRIELDGKRNNLRDELRPKLAVSTLEKRLSEKGIDTTVTLALNPEDAVEYLGRQNYDLVISDIGMYFRDDKTSEIIGKGLLDKIQTESGLQTFKNVYGSIRTNFYPNYSSQELRELLKEPKDVLSFPYIEHDCPGGKIVIDECNRKDIKYAVFSGGHYDTSISALAIAEASSERVEELSQIKKMREIESSFEPNFAEDRISVLRNGNYWLATTDIGKNYATLIEQMINEKQVNC